MSESLLSCVAFGFALAYLVFIWFQTHFVVEYGQLLGLNKLLKVEQWNKYSEKEADPKYPHFLREEYPCWGTKLLGCPFCVIGFTSIFLTFLVAWWAWGVISFFASSGFLFLMTMYKYVYSGK